jgi:sucrose-6-phosphate hydrolase SacC (GH32 family)
MPATLADDNAITLEQLAGQSNYDQPLRPQFHFTTLQGHIGDATGLVRYRGEYHLFNIYDEWSRKSQAHKRWSHAISTDLVHWAQMPPLLDTIVDHSPGSGSGVVDWNNSSGLRDGPEKTLVVFYTDYKRGSSIVYSNDRGRHWVRYAGNPVVPGADDARDPNVFWYAPANGWRMVRYEKKGFAFYESQDLRHWTWLSRIDGYYECPDLFELPIVEHADESRWVLIDGNGSYVLGIFDGRQFVPQTEKLKAEYGPALYATQTWKFPPEDGVAYQIAWMRYPGLPQLTWNGQMSFPVKLTLQRFPDGIRLCREPVSNIDGLAVARQYWKDVVVKEGQKLIPELTADLLDLTVNIDFSRAYEFGINVRGQTIKYSVSEQNLSVGSSYAPLKLADGTLKLRILVDRSSVEVFADRGEVTFSMVTLEPADASVSLFCKGGEIHVHSLAANHLESIWSDHK